MRRPALLFFSTFAIAAAAGAGLQVARARKPGAITLVVTNELRGRDRRCGCQGARPTATSDAPVHVPVCSCSKKATFGSIAAQLPDLGGLPERSAWLATVRREGPVAQLDTGDLLFPGLFPQDVERSEWLRRARLLVEGYDLLGVGAATPGEVDLALGRQALVDLFRGARLQVVSANLVDRKSGASLFPGHAKLRAGPGSDATVGVVGIFAPPETPELAAVLSREGLDVGDPFAALASEVRELRREGVDLVVLLAHAPEPRVRELAHSVPGVDLAFAAHAEFFSGERGHLEGSTAIAQALRGGGAPLVARVALQPGARGVVDSSTLQEARVWCERLEGQLAQQTHALSAAPDEAARRKAEEQIAWTKAKLGENRALLSGEPHHAIDLVAVPLQASDWREGKDPALLQAIDRFKSEVSASPPAADVVAALEHGDDLRTARGCAECHPKQAAVWKDSPHAHAWETLVKAHDERDPECVRCHSVGFRAPGGFATVDRAVRPAPGPAGVSLDFRDVQCEACHGARGRHPDEKGIGTRVPGAETCTRCHDPEHDPSFTIERLNEARKRGVVLCTKS